MPAFLADPLSDLRQLDTTSVNSKLGELSCAGLTGHTKFLEGDIKHLVSFETRRHEKAPFGVVTSRIRIEIERADAAEENLDMELTLSDLGETATSELPDHN
jgi:hypothetical protein